MIVKISRDGYKVLVDGVQYHINPQTSKGPGNEIVELKKMNHPELQQSISLSKIPDGCVDFEFELAPRKEVTSKKDYELTEDEQKQVNELQAQIDAIKDAARARYIPSKAKAKDPNKMSAQELKDYIASLEARKEELEKQAKGL